MKVELTPEHLESIFSIAILNALDDETKNTLIQGAITYLTQPVKVNYGNQQKLSPLELAFRSALDASARKHIEQYLQEHEEFDKKVREIIDEAIGQIMGDKKDRIVGKMVNIISDNLFGGY